MTTPDARATRTPQPPVSRCSRPRLRRRLPAAAAAEPTGTEIRIPLGAGGVGFLPLLVMKERGLIEKHARGRRRVRPRRSLDRARRARRHERRAAVGLRRLHRRGAARVHHALGPHARLRRHARRRRDVVAADVPQHDEPSTRDARRPHGRRTRSPSRPSRCRSRRSTCRCTRPRSTGRPRRSGSTATPSR